MGVDHHASLLPLLVVGVHYPSVLLPLLVVGVHYPSVLAVGVNQGISITGSSVRPTITDGGLADGRGVDWIEEIIKIQMILISSLIG